MSLFSGLVRPLKPQRTTAALAYLNQADSTTDLELRMREITAGPYNPSARLR